MPKWEDEGRSTDPMPYQAKTSGADSEYEWRSFCPSASLATVATKTYYRYNKTWPEIGIKSADGLKMSVLEIVKTHLCAQDKEAIVFWVGDYPAAFHSAASIYLHNMVKDPGSYFYSFFDTSYNEDRPITDYTSPDGKGIIIYKPKMHGYIWCNGLHAHNYTWGWRLLSRVIWVDVNWYLKMNAERKRFDPPQFYD